MRGKERWEKEGRKKKSAKKRKKCPATARRLHWDELGRRRGAKGSGFCRAGMFGARFRAFLCHRTEPSSAPGAVPAPPAPHKSLFGVVFVFWSIFPASKPQGRPREPLLRRHRSRAPAEPPGPSSPLSWPFSPLLRFFGRFVPVLILSPALPGHPRGLSPKFPFSLPLAEPPARGGGTGSVPVPESQQPRGVEKRCHRQKPGK